MKDEEHLLLTTKQAAQYLGIAPEKVRELAAQEHNPLPQVWLPRAKFPYYTKDSIRKWIQSITV